MTPPTRRRTRARETAMQLLFQFDLRGQDYGGQVGLDLEGLVVDAGGADPDVRAFAVRLLGGTLEQIADIDERLRSVTRNWDLKRMAAVDRNILRMAIYELTSCKDVPPKVAINEAIDLGKKFSTANSGGFINGILDRVRIDLEKERTQAVDSHQS